MQETTKDFSAEPPDAEDEDSEGSDLERRFRIQMCFLEPGEPKTWETVTSADHLRGGLRALSICCERIKQLVETRWSDDLPPGLVLLRIYDEEEGRVLLWEEENGNLGFVEGLDFTG